MSRLSELAVGEWGVVQSVAGPREIRRRLEIMGFVPGVLVHVSRCAPMGDPRAYELLGYCISLRKEEADLITVKRLDVYLLNEVSGGEFRVVAVRGGHGVRQRLAQLGITEDKVLRVDNSGSGGRVTVEVEGRRIQVGRGMAAKILVRGADDSQQEDDPGCHCR